MGPSRSASTAAGGGPEAFEQRAQLHRLAQAADRSEVGAAAASTNVPGNNVLLEGIEQTIRA